MLDKYQPTLEKSTVEGFGLRSGDTDSHCPSFYIVRKNRELSHADRHQRSEEGKKRDAERRKEKRRERKRARAGA